MGAISRKDNTYIIVIIVVILTATYEVAGGAISRVAVLTHALVRSFRVDAFGVLRTLPVAVHTLVAV